MRPNGSDTGRSARRESRGELVLVRCGLCGFMSFDEGFASLVDSDGAGSGGALLTGLAIGIVDAAELRL